MKKVLIIEDEAILLRLLLKILEKHFEIICANNGQEGIELLDESVDLVLTDLMMPYKSGKEVVIESKKYPNIKIIVLSSIHLENNVIELFELGIDDYIRKPFIPKELLFKIKKLI